MRIRTVAAVATAAAIIVTAAPAAVAAGNATSVANIAGPTPYANYSIPTTEHLDPQQGVPSAWINHPSHH